MNKTQDQQHPQENTDRQVISRLLNGQPTDENLLDLARLRIRYNNFPGARDLQKDLDYLLKQWQFTEEELYAKTRHIYEQGSLNKKRNLDEQQDWS